MLCPVCLQSMPEAAAVTGWELCPACKKLNDDGYLAVVEIDRVRSTGTKPEDVWRTGRILHIRRRVASEIFSIDTTGVLLWCDPEVFDKLKGMAE